MDKSILRLKNKLFTSIPQPKDSHHPANNTNE